MKETFRIIFVVVAASTVIFAQNVPPPASIGFVNAVGLKTRTDFQLDGKSVKRTGFAEGGYAISFQISEGNHQATFANADCDRAVQSISAGGGASALYVLYKVALRQPDGRAKNLLKVVAIPPQSAVREPRLLAFSTLEGRAISLRVNGSDVRVEPFKLLPLPSPTLSLDGAGIRPARYEPDEPGNYILVLFDGSSSTVHSTLVPLPR
jgi:hypothetical protein